MQDILVILGAVTSSLGFVSWGSETTRDRFFQASKFFLNVKEKLAASTLTFFVISGAINLGSGAYLVYAVLSGVDPVTAGTAIAYIFIANCFAFFVGIVLYLVNIPIRSIYYFISWTVEHDFEKKWKLICVFMVVCLAAYTITTN